jgi:hypothetical protein
MKKFLKTLIVVFIAVNLYSLIPVISFYLGKTPEGKVLNKDVVEKLKNNEGPYFSFIVTSDTGNGLFFNDASTLKVVSGINREKRFKKVPIDFVANVGDVTFRGSPSDYKNYIKIKNMIEFPVIDIIGNHDNDYEKNGNAARLFNEYCGDADFSFTDRNSYFIVLDDKDGNFSEFQFQRLENELKKSGSFTHKFIFMHKPPFNPYQQSWYRIETNPWSLRFMELCDKYRVDMVFSGHEYVCRAVKFGSTTYIVSGGGGTILMEASSEEAFLNYIFVKVNGSYIDYEIRKVNPPIWEYFSYYMWKDLVFFVKGWMN